MKKTVKIKEIENSKGKTDWKHLKKSDSPEVNDPEAPVLTDYEISQLEKVNKD